MILKQHPLFISLFLLLFLSNCSSNSTSSENTKFESILTFQYAKGIQIYKTSEGDVVTILNPITGETLDHFIVTEKKTVNMKNIKVVTKPIKNLLTYSSTYLSFLDAINEIEKVKGVTFSQGIYNTQIIKQLENKQTIDVGNDQTPDKELIISLQPNLALIYPSNGNHDWFYSFQIPTIKNVEYLEIHPLAQSEWIKLYGVLFEKEELADSIFRSIEKQYLEEIVTDSNSDKPTVLCGELYDNVWTLPGGKSYTSKLIEDAGGSYFYSNDSSSGSKKLDYEYILSQDSGIDYWMLLTYNHKDISFDFLQKNIPRYSLLSVFEPNKIGVCNTAKTPYFEKAILEPHILLKEIKNLIHPNYTLDSTFYIKSLPIK